MSSEGNESCCFDTGQQVIPYYSSQNPNFLGESVKSGVENKLIWHPVC